MLTQLTTSACPGAQLAQSIMFIFAATVLSVFDIGKVTINGVVQEPKNEFSSGVLVYVLTTVLKTFLPETGDFCVGVRNRSRVYSNHARPRRRI